MAELPAAVRPHCSIDGELWGNKPGSSLIFLAATQVQPGDTTMINKAKIGLSVAIMLGVLGAASAALAGSKDDDGGSGGGYVVGGSMDGVNPALHPDIFGNVSKPRGYAAPSGNTYGYVVAPSALKSFARAHKNLR
jgi:hypothetical protein